MLIISYLFLLFLSYNCWSNVSLINFFFLSNSSFSFLFYSSYFSYSYLIISVHSSFEISDGNDSLSRLSCYFLFPSFNLKSAKLFELSFCISSLCLFIETNMLLFWTLLERNGYPLLGSSNTRLCKILWFLPCPISKPYWFYLGIPSA